MLDEKNVLSSFRDVKQIGRNKYMARCPAHDDRNPSLSISVLSDKILIHCHAGCHTESIIRIVGLKWSDLFDNRHFDRAPRTKTAQGLTLELYSKAKHLPQEFLKSISVKDINIGKNAIEIPYLDEAGKIVAKRLRLSLSGSGTFRWRKGDKPIPYGLWRIDKSQDYIFLVEGESDAQTLWFIMINALSIPGANFWRDEQLKGALSHFSKIYVVIEPDIGGKTLLNAIRKSRFQDKIYVIQIEDHKDISELYLSNPQAFPEAVEQLIRTAVPIASLPSEVFESIYPKKPFDDSDAVFGAINSLTSVSSKDILGKNELIQSLAQLKIGNIRRYELFFSELKEKGLTIREINQVKSVVSQAAKQLKTISKTCVDGEEKSVSCFIPDAPLSDQLRVPSGYTIAHSGIYREITNEHDRLISTGPILITKRFMHLNEGIENLELSYYRDGKWIKKAVPRSFVADTQKIVSLSDYGVPVTSKTARDLVGYLQLFESLNLEAIPVSLMSSKLGWLDKSGDKGFLFGKFHIKPRDSVNSVEDDSIRAHRKIFFHGNDLGDNQIAKSYSSIGTRKACIANLERISGYTVPVFMVCASLAAPLLQIFDLPSFIVDLSGPTTSGKTTCLKIAASAWGDPIEGNPNSALRSWNATIVHLERSLVLLNGIPLILDDTKLAGRPGYLSRVVYGSSSGQGRGRGSIAGTAQTGNWRTIILSTGENKITDLVKRGDAGAHARVLTITMPPFGKTSRRQANLINKIIPIISANYGKIGLIYIRHLLRHRSLWDDWRDEYWHLSDYYRKSSPKSGIVARLAPNMAVIHQAGILAQKALKIDLKLEKHLQAVWESISKEVHASSNMALNALEFVVAEAVSRQDHFWSPDKSEKQQPHQGWLGRWDYEGDLALISSVLKKLLESRGYEPNAVLREWKAKRWLKTSGEKKGISRKMKIGDKRVRCYLIKRRIVEKL